MTIRFLLDTGIISAPIAKRRSERVIRRLTQLAPRCAIAAPVWHELMYGYHRLPDGARKSVLADYLQSVVRPSFPILPYDEVAAAWHAEQRARLERAGKALPFVDGQIAAIAARNDLTIVTTNAGHFAPFGDVEVTDWTR